MSPGPPADRWPTRSPGLVWADGDRAAFPGRSAPGGQRAGAAGRAELRFAGVAVAAAGPDGHGDPSRAGDGLAVQVDGEAVLGEAAFHRGRRLALDAVI